MKTYLKHILDEIDYYISKQKGVDAFDWPVDFPEAEGTIKPILSTFHDDYGLVFIMKIVPEGENPVYVLQSW